MPHTSPSPERRGGETISRERRERERRSSGGQRGPTGRPTGPGTAPTRTTPTRDRDDSDKRRDRPTVRPEPRRPEVGTPGKRTIPSGGIRTQVGEPAPTFSVGDIAIDPNKLRGQVTRVTPLGGGLQRVTLQTGFGIFTFNNTDLRVTGEQAQPTVGGQRGGQGGGQGRSITPSQAEAMRRAGVSTDDFIIRDVDPRTGLFVEPETQGRGGEEPTTPTGQPRRPPPPTEKRPDETIPEFLDRVGAGTGEPTAVRRTNTFGNPARPNFDPFTTLPVSIFEVPAAREAIRSETRELKDIFQMPTEPSVQEQARGIRVGSYVVPDTTGTLQLADTTDVDRILFLEELRDTVPALEAAHADFAAESEGLFIQEFFQQQSESLEFARDLAIDRAGSEADVDAATALFDREISRLILEMEEAQVAAQTQQNFSLALAEREAELRAEAALALENFHRVQNELNRKLRTGELDEAERAARAIEELRTQELDLDRQQFQIQVFATLAASPEMLFFLQQVGGLALFENALGPNLSNLFQNLQQSLQGGESPNIQQFSRLSGQEQSIEKFRIAATTGVRDPEAELRGAAPFSRKGLQDLGGQITPGRASATFRPIRIGA